MLLLQEVQTECGQGEGRRKDIAKAESRAGGSQRVKKLECRPSRAAVAAVGHGRKREAISSTMVTVTVAIVGSPHHIGVERLDAGQSEGKVQHGDEGKPNGQCLMRLARDSSILDHGNRVSCSNHIGIDLLDSNSKHSPIDVFQR